MSREARDQPLCPASHQLERCMATTDTGSALIGPDAFEDERTLRSIASLLAQRIVIPSYEEIASAHLVYVLCGTDWEGLERIHRLGELTYARLVELPEPSGLGDTANASRLSVHVEATRIANDWFRVIGGEWGAGAIIVSEIDEPVSYASMLAGRVANLVPLDDLKRFAT